MMLVGLGGPLVMPPVTAVLLNSVPGHLAGTASGVFNTSRQVGGALAVAVFGTLLARQGMFTHGLRVSLLIAAAVALAAAGAAGALRAPRGLRPKTAAYPAKSRAAAPRQLQLRQPDDRVRRAGYYMHSTPHEPPSTTEGHQ